MKFNTQKFEDAYLAAPYGDPLHKQTISRMGKAVLRKVAEAMGLSRSDYDVRYNPGGIACSGEVTLHTDFVYAQICHGFGKTPATILFRACEGRGDYTGKANHYLNVQSLECPEEVAQKLTYLARRYGTL